MTGETVPKESYDALKVEHEIANKRVAQLERKLEEAQSSSSQSLRLLEKAQGETVNSINEITDLKKERDSLKKERNDVKNERDRLQKEKMREIGELNLKLAGAKSALERTQKALDQLKNKEKNAAAGTGEKQPSGPDNANANIKQELENVRKQLQTAENANDQFMEQVVGLTSQVKELQKSNDNKTAEIVNAHDEAAKAVQDLKLALEQFGAHDRLDHDKLIQVEEAKRQADAQVASLKTQALASELRDIESRKRVEDLEAKNQDLEKKLSTRLDASLSKSDRLKALRLLASRKGCVLTNTIQTATPNVFKLDLPFENSLTLYGRRTQTIYVSIHGYVAFTHNFRPHGPGHLPFADLGDNIVMFPLWENFTIAQCTPQGVQYAFVDGGASGRSTHIEWHVSKAFDENQIYHFELWYRQDSPNRVFYNYYLIPDPGKKNIVGIQKGSSCIWPGRVNKTEYFPIKDNLMIEINTGDPKLVTFDTCTPPPSRQDWDRIQNARYQEA